ncbi:hypothetical protein HYS54_04830 [Candidatus Micrarchaeota archaeon]|nr:hypothetical protein [Candidatus Micrarchaeota archaeon]
MTLDVETVNLLKKEFGFTENHLFIYDYLLQKREATAEEVFRNAEVPKGRVYEFLNDLAESGFVTEIYGRPKRYQFKPPVQAFRDALTLKESHLLEVERDAIRIASKLGSIESVAGETTIQLVNDFEEYVSLNLKDLLSSSASRTVGASAVSIITRDELPNSTHYNLFIRAYLDRITAGDANVKLIFASDLLANMAKGKNHPYTRNLSELLRYPKLKMRYSTEEKMEAFLRFQVFDQSIYLRYAPDKWVYIQSPKIAEKFITLYDHFFEGCKPVDQAFVEALRSGRQPL